MDKVPMTAAGYAALDEELRHRQQEERPRIIQAIAEARAHGDLSENAEYHAAKEAQSLNEGRIAELEDKLSRAEVIDVSKLSGIDGEIRRDGHGRRRGHRGGEGLSDRRRERSRREERPRLASPRPIARALIGKKAGDTVEVKTPGGGKSYEILKVAFV